MPQFEQQNNDRQNDNPHNDERQKNAQVSNDFQNSDLQDIDKHNVDRQNMDLLSKCRPKIEQGENELLQNEHRDIKQQDKKLQKAEEGEDRDNQHPHNPPTLFEIFKVFFKIGSVGFGGGPALISIIQQEVVQKKRWLPEEEYLQGMAVSLMPPGSIMVNIAFFVGHYLRGFWGGFLALSGILLPSFFLMVILASVLISFKTLNMQTNAIKGMAPAVVGVLTALVIRMAREHIDKWWGIIILAGTVLMIFYFKTPPFLLIFFSMLIGGAGWIFIERKKSRNA